MKKFRNCHALKGSSLHFLFTLHEDIILRQQKGGYLRQFPHRGAVGVRDDGAKFIQSVVQVVHPPAFARVDVQSDALPLASRLRFRGAVQSRARRSEIIML
jgi:hypothetical protein